MCETKSMFAMAPTLTIFSIRKFLDGIYVSEKGVIEE